MPGQAAKIELSERQLEILQRITRESTAPVRLVQRCRIIMLGFEGRLNEDIARDIRLHRKQVGTWRRRWQQSFDALISIECHETASALRRAIEEVLSDAPRPGSPGHFTAEQVTAIIALACEPPANSGRPIDFWTHREIVDEAVKRSIVSSISESQVGRYLRAAALQPHKSEYWLNTKEKDPQEFERQVQIVCQTYLDAPDLYYQSNTHTVSTDEMTGVQALERIANTIPMQPGQPERREFEYKRHGTVCLIGNWDVVAGQMIAPSLGPTRTELDFCWHVHDTVETDPDAGWIFVVDQLNIHSSESLVRYVAGLEGIPRSELGKKRAVGNPQVGGDPTGVSLRRESSYSFCVPAEAHVVVEPDRDNLRYPAASSPASREFPLSRGTDTASV